MDGTGGFLNTLVKLNYSADLPYNCFPSLHVAYAFIGALVLWNYKRTWAYTYLACAIIVAISVVLVKQHYILDVVGGFITPFIAYYLACKVTKPVYLDAPAFEQEEQASL